MLTAEPKTAGDRKLILPEEKYNATNFLTLWDFEGVFKYSPIFYGWYTNRDETDDGYRLPFAYFVTGLVVYAYSFFAILRRMAVNSRMSKLSDKDDECVFSWKVFTGWDYMIGNAETAHNKVASIVMGLKAALLEEAEKKREAKNWKIIGSRILVNIGIVGLLSSSAYAVILVVERSKDAESTSTVWRRNEITLVMGLISVIFPTLFEIIGMVEHYHPRTQLRLQLARIMVLNLLNLYSLIFALFGKITEMSDDLKKLKPNITNETAEMLNKTGLSILEHTVTECICPTTASKFIAASQILTTIISNLSSTALIPKLIQTFSTAATTIENRFDVPTQNSTEVPWLNDTIYDYDYDYNGYSDSSDTPNESMNLSNLTLEISNSTWNVSTNTTEFFRDYDLNWNASNIPFEVNFTTDVPDTTDWNTFTVEILKSTVRPWLNVTSSTQSDVDDETELSTIVSDITTLIEKFQKNTSEQCVEICNEITTLKPTQSSEFSVTTPTNYVNRSKLRSLCWETMFGQELVKLTIMDMILNILSTLGVDFFRGIFVRIMNNCWCWDLEKKFPQYGDFKVAENILHLVNNQGMVWMGMFFAPGLVVINVIKLYLMMYFRTWTVLTCNVPHKIIFRASKSNNFYFGLLLMMLFLCVLPVGYAIVWLDPSWHCGPFSTYPKIFHIFTETVMKATPKKLHGVLNYIVSPGIVIPLLVLLILIIYYLVSLTSALREANNDLKIQLRRERTEERRKMFQIAIGDRSRRINSSGSADLSQTPFAKWKKLLNDMPYGKSIDDTPKQESQEAEEAVPKEETSSKSKDFFSKLLKLALRKSSETEDTTETDPNESLPEEQPNRNSSDQRIQTKTTNEPAVHKSKPESAIASSQVEPQKQQQSKERTKATREDSSASVWSENIPTITISKTESAECILEKDDHKASGSNRDFKPKIKYALRKQEAEVDIDSITYISSEIVQKYEAVSSVEDKRDFVKGEEEKQAVRAVHEESVKTESSSDYKDVNLS